MMKTKNMVYVFDLDNTLIKTNIANNLSYKEAINVVAGIDIKINSRQRITRYLLRKYVQNLSELAVNEIIAKKESCFEKYIHETSLNDNLYRLLRIIHETGNETILLTNCHKGRAMQLSSHYCISKYFTRMFYSEDFADDKYSFLKQMGYDLTSVILFENDINSMKNAKTYGIKRAVIYNEKKHIDNPMYDLNRIILQEDRSVIRIDSTNMVENVKLLVEKESELMLF